MFSNTETITLLMAWYASTLVSTIMSKSAIKQHVRPLLVTLTQMTISVWCDVIFLVYIVAKARFSRKRMENERGKMSLARGGSVAWGLVTECLGVVRHLPSLLPRRIDPLLPLLPCPVLLCVSKILTYMSYEYVPVSLTHTLKALQPLFTVLLSKAFFGESYSWPVIVSLLPVVGGVILSSGSEVRSDISNSAPFGIICAAFSALFGVAEKMYTQQRLRDSQGMEQIMPQFLRSPDSLSSPSSSPSSPPPLSSPNNGKHQLVSGVKHFPSLEEGIRDRGSNVVIQAGTGGSSNHRNYVSVMRSGASIDTPSSEDLNHEVYEEENDCNYRSSGQCRGSNCSGTNCAAHSDLIGYQKRRLSDIGVGGETLTAEVGLERWKRSVVLHLIVGAGGVILTTPLVILDEQIQASSNLSLSQALHMVFFSVTNYCASIASLVLLEFLNIISWQVANVMKRLVLIAGSVLYFKNPIHFWNVAGITIAMSGLMSYNVAKLGDRKGDKVDITGKSVNKVGSRGVGSHTRGKQRRAALGPEAPMSEGTMQRTFERNTTV